MEMISDLQAMGLSLDPSAHAASDDDTRSPEPALTLVHVKCDDLDLSSLDGVQELQDRLEHAIAEARWASAGF